MLSRPQGFTRTHLLPELTGMSLPSIYRLERRGQFPKIVKFCPGGRASGVLTAVLSDYLAARARGEAWTQASREKSTETLP